MYSVWAEWAGPSRKSLRVQQLGLNRRRFVQTPPANCDEAPAWRLHVCAATVASTSARNVLAEQSGHGPCLSICCGTDTVCAALPRASDTNKRLKWLSQVFVGPFFCHLLNQRQLKCAVTAHLVQRTCCVCAVAAHRSTSVTKQGLVLIRCSCKHCGHHTFSTPPANHTINQASSDQCSREREHNWWWWWWRHCSCNLAHMFGIA